MPRETEFSAYNAVREFLDPGASIDRITMISDCNVSLSRIDANGDFAGVRVARNTERLGVWQKHVHAGVLPIEHAAGLVAGNAAAYWGWARARGTSPPASTPT